jgi:hypothetical protein
VGRDAEGIDAVPPGRKGTRVQQVGIRKFGDSVVIDGLSLDQVADALRDHAIYRHMAEHTVKLAQPDEQASPVVPPTPELVPRLGAPGTASSRPWVSVVRGKITIEPSASGPNLTPEDVQAALDIYVKVKQVAPDWLPDRLGEIIATASQAEEVVIEVDEAETPPPGGILRHLLPLTLTEFQDACWQTASYPRAGDCPLYALLGLVNEVGEALEAIIMPITLAALEDDKAPHEPVLDMAISLGRIAGVVKKAYRNIDPATQESGVITDEALDAVQAAIEVLSEDLTQLADRVQLPQVVLTNEEKGKFSSELGDVFWYLTGTLTETGLQAEGVARALLAKLRKRAEAGTLRSSGDDETTRPPGAEHTNPTGG